MVALTVALIFNNLTMVSGFIYLSLGNISLLPYKFLNIGALV
nr:MAG TPA: hypothetical protein [Caudoviricetes sp.]